MASKHSALTFLVLFVMTATLLWTISAAPIESIQWTCDVIGSSRLCALHCMENGYSTGACENTVCQCRRR
ncbi:hypothetical protein CHUAL_002127 [Chamberlinius hualienensis]